MLAGAVFAEGLRWGKGAEVDEEGWGGCVWGLGAEPIKVGLSHFFGGVLWTTGFGSGCGKMNLLWVR